MILNKLETERLTLRPFSPDDVDLMQQLDSDADVVRYLGHGKIKTKEEIKNNLNKILSDYQKYGLGLFAAFEKSSGNFTGRCGLIPWHLDGALTWEIGYSLKKSEWGKGFATEAATALSVWARENLNVSYVVSLIHPDNYQSIHVAEKTGMKRWKEISISQFHLVAYRKDF